MNERIKELIKSLGIIPEDEHYEVAELIVRECSKVITNGGYWHHITKGWSQATPPEIAKMVREHFGVEE
jgi:hypothetical protein